MHGSLAAGVTLTALGAWGHGYFLVDLTVKDSLIIASDALFSVTAWRMVNEGELCAVGRHHLPIFPTCALFAANDHIVGATVCAIPNG